MWVEGNAVQQRYEHIPKRKGGLETGINTERGVNLKVGRDRTNLISSLLADC
jgi:hypothetical protein